MSIAVGRWRRIKPHRPGALERSSRRHRCRSVGDEAMTRRISAVAVCCSSASASVLATLSVPRSAADLRLQLRDPRVAIVRHHVHPGHPAPLRDGPGYHAASATPCDADHMPQRPTREGALTPSHDRGPRKTADSSARNWPAPLGPYWLRRPVADGARRAPYLGRCRSWSQPLRRIALSAVMWELGDWPGGPVRCVTAPDVPSRLCWCRTRCGLRAREAGPPPPLSERDPRGGPP